MKILTLKTDAPVLSKQEQSKIKGGTTSTHTATNIIIIDVDSL